MLIELIRKGGFTVGPIILCSAIMLAIAVERFIRLRAARSPLGELMGKIEPLVRQGRTDDAAAECAKVGGLAPKVLRTGLSQGTDPRACELAVSNAASAEIGKLETFVEGLSTIATIAPMLGLLGTVLGIIRSFYHIQSMGGQVNASVLAGGIWESLIATAAGLVVAIPSFILYRWISGLIDGLTEEAAWAGMKLVEWLNFYNGTKG
jgi:biopolymer transport protein ExbB